jgi:2-iminobutanoate/2-iminopropanoate deaminase
MTTRILSLISTVALAVPSMHAQVGTTPSQTHAQRRYFKLPPPSQSPVSQAVLVGDTLYISGRVGLDPRSGKAPDNLDDELKNLFDIYKAVLADAGMTMDDLVYVEVSASDLSLYDKFNAAYRAQFSKDFPARGFVGAGSVFRGGHFEMMGIAVRR